MEKLIYCDVERDASGAPVISTWVVGQTVTVRFGDDDSDRDSVTPIVH